MKILLSGGHLTPALAFARYALRQPNVSLAFVGRHFTQEQTGQVAREEHEVRQLGIPFYALTAGKRIIGGSVRQLFGQLGKFVAGIRHADQLLGEIEPDVFVSFGSYLAVPVAIACARRRIPIVTHEQTRSLSLTTQLLSIVADKVAISFPQMLKQLPRKKVVMTGLPLRPELFALNSPQPAWFAPSDRPLLYVAGGSQGSQAINAWTWKHLAQLLTQFDVIHQVGGGNHPDLTTLQKLESSPSLGMYVAREWVTPQELAWVYRHCALAISRSGANTVAEFVAFQVPALYVPLPASARDEQRLNAAAVAAVGGATVMNQHELDRPRTFEVLSQILTQREVIRVKLASLSHEYPPNGDEKLFAVVSDLVPSEGQTSPS